MTCIFVCLSWLVYSTNKLARIQTRTQRKPCTAVRSCCFMGQFAQWNVNGTGKDGIDHSCHRRPMSNGRTWRRQTWWVTWIQNGVHVYTLWFIFGRNWLVTAALSHWYCRDDFNVKTKYRNVHIRSALPNRSTPNGSAICPKIVAPKKIDAPSASSKNLTESMHKYIIQARHMLLKITIAATTTCFTGVGLYELSCVSNTLQALPMTH